jgi:hypothetical protein
MTTRAEKARAQSALGVSSLVQLEIESSSDGCLPKMIYEYYAGGSDCQESLADNRSCFSRFKLVPRLLRDVSTVNGRAKLFGVHLMLFVLQSLGSELTLAISFSDWSVHAGRMRSIFDS